MPDHEYADLEIRIRAKSLDAYPVEVTCEGREFPRGTLLLAKQPARPTGEALFDWFFSDENFKLAWTEIQGSHPRRRIRLNIDQDAPELQLLPWESLRDARSQRQPRDFAAMDATPFSRYVAGQWDPGQPVQRNPLKVLVVISNPSNLKESFDLEPIKADDEWKVVKEVFAGRNDVELVRMPGPATLANIQASMRNGFAILHFVGHGKITGEKSVIYLEEDKPERKAFVVSDRDFAAMIARQSWESGRLSLVFLCSCQTAAASAANAFDGFGPRLVEAGIPAVVAMQSRVRVSTAREFTTVFYRDLLMHGVIDLAANAARSALMATGIGGASVPVLYMRMEDGRLFNRPVPEPQPTPAPPPPAPAPQPSASRRWLLLAAIVVLAVSLVSIYRWENPTVLLEYSIYAQPLRDAPPLPDENPPRKVPDGEPFILAPDATIPQNAGFFLKFKTFSEGHLYIWYKTIVEGQQGFILLSSEPAASSLIKPGDSRRPISSWIQFDAPNRTESLYLVFSKRPITKFEEIISDQGKIFNNHIVLRSTSEVNDLDRLLDSLPRGPRTTSGEKPNITQLIGTDQVSHLHVLEHK